jgi:Protein of unknown function (DUF3142)
MAGGVALKLRSPGGKRVAGPMPGAVYVWQRVWSEPVVAAVKTAPAWVDGLAPLGAEVAWRSDGSPEVAWPNVDFAALRLAGRTTGAVLRVGPCAASPATAPLLCGVARELLARFRAGAVEPAELQVDFDCAASQLEGYRFWLAALREAVAPVAVQPTVLPSWLDQPAFATLARECGGYILQVHATERPRLDAPETALCEAARARVWVERAGRIGVPFRVALPTYSYVVGFAPKGKLLGILAEGEARVWPPGTVVRAFRPDAMQLAGLVGGWLKDRPASLTGLIWYRLPVATDTLNWRWPTLSAVAAGRSPRRELHVETSGTSPMDMTLVNAGETEEPLPSEVVVTSSEAGAEADGVGGYRAATRGDDVVFQRAPELAPLRLAPGMRHPLGWVRGASEFKIHVR